MAEPKYFIGIDLHKTVIQAQWKGSCNEPPNFKKPSRDVAITEGRSVFSVESRDSSAEVSPHFMVVALDLSPHRIGRDAEELRHFPPGLASIKQRLSLENSGFSRLCRKAMKRLSDDTTHFHYLL